MQNQTHTTATPAQTHTEQAFAIQSPSTREVPVALELAQLAMVSGGTGGSTDAPKTTW